MTTEKSTDVKPNFVLCDMSIPSSFSKMCQNFKKEISEVSQPMQDWLIIDNETGEIISSPIQPKK